MNIIYNSFLEKEVFNGASSFFLQHNFSTTYLQIIPKQFKNVLGNRTPDIIATELNATSINSKNLYDIKGILSHTTNQRALGLIHFKPKKDNFPELKYTLIHHGLTSHEKFTQIIFGNKGNIPDGVLLYCPRLMTVLEAQTNELPLTGIPVKGWFNFESGIFKPFKDIIFP
jgi:hypothetical protein